jgi:hypothetical protein
MAKTTTTSLARTGWSREGDDVRIGESSIDSMYERIDRANSSSFLVAREATSSVNLSSCSLARA